MKDKIVKIILVTVFLIIFVLILLLAWAVVKKTYSSAPSYNEGSDGSSGFLDITNVILSAYPLGVQEAKPILSKEDIGEKSELFGKLQIRIEESNLGSNAGSAQEEYLYIVASPSNKEAIKISGLVFQSILTRKAALVPKGAEYFLLGSANSIKDIYLNPGEAAIVYSGKSPLGVSFRENKCMGYLNKVYDFYPPLPDGLCPSAREILPSTVENINKYGDSCIDATLSLSRCEYFLSDNEFYDKVSKECKSFLQDNLNYNACVAREKEKSDFFPFNASTWRIYLGRDSKIWKDKYEAIKLIDKEGKTIDYISY